MSAVMGPQVNGGGLSTVPSRLDLLAKETVARDRSSVRGGGSALTSALREVYPFTTGDLAAGQLDK
jgi:hypothetical protein